MGDRPAEAESAGRRAVGAVCADDDLGPVLDVADLEGQIPWGSTPRNLDPVAEVRPRGDRLLGEIVVEPPPLGHQHERASLAAALEPRVPAEPEGHPVDLVLDDRRGVDGELREPPAG